MTFTWQDVLNHLQTLTPEQLNNEVQVDVAGGDYMTLSGLTTETHFRNGHSPVDVPVFEY
jgi:hypothetical protein